MRPNSTVPLPNPIVSVGDRGDGAFICSATFLISLLRRLDYFHYYYFF